MVNEFGYEYSSAVTEDWQVDPYGFSHAGTGTVWVPPPTPYVNNGFYTREFGNNPIERQVAHDAQRQRDRQNDLFALGHLALAVGNLWNILR